MVWEQKSYTIAIATNLIEKSRVNHKEIDSDLVIVMLDPDLFIVMLVLWKHLVFSAFWQEMIYQSFRAFRWSFKKAQRKLLIQRGMKFARMRLKGLWTVEMQFFFSTNFCHSSVLVWKWVHKETLDQCNGVVDDLLVYTLWLLELVFPLFNLCGNLRGLLLKPTSSFH